MFKVIVHRLRAVKALLCLNAVIAEDMPIQMVQFARQEESSATNVVE